MGEFDRFRALSFDCYGTLIDWETGIKTALEPWANRHRIEPEALLAEFGRIESSQERRYPTNLYPEILRRVLGEIGARRGIEVTRAEASGFAASVGDWPPFADSPAALKTLKERFKLMILSNVDLDSFSRSNERLGVDFDLILTAEEIGSYKPAARNFEALIRAAGRVGVGPDRLLHVAQSLYHDHIPARDSGLATVWIDRRLGEPGFGATPPPGVEITPDWVFPSMAAFAEATAG